MAPRAIFLVLCSLAGATASAAPRAPAAARPVKNVILLLSDGTAPEAWPLTRWVTGKPLAVDGILTGAVRTYGADSIITDSAPGATAFATGFKGSDKGISVGAFNVSVDAALPQTAPAHAPIATLLEGAKLGGRAVGLVATSHVQHATPAAFSAHVPHRDSYEDIAEQQVHQDIDVVLGGGVSWLLPRGLKPGARTDGENLVEVVKARGYEFVEDAAKLSKVKGRKVWGAFADEELAYDLDRARLAPAQPTLAQMTERAIDLLSRSDRGFFLFVEGSKVDWAAHANDPVAVVSDLRAFDDAVRAAVEFAERDGDTLVVVVSDHGTGGLTIGTADDPSYSTTDDDAVVPPLRDARLTATGLYRTLLQGQGTAQEVRSAFQEEWKLDALPPAALDELVKAVVEGRRLVEQREKFTDPEKRFVKVAAPLKSRQARIGWTTPNHTGADVFLYSYGPDRPTGLWQNTDLGRSLAERMGIDLAAVTRRLFVEAGPAFADLGLEARVERKEGDVANPVLVVSRAGRSLARLPISKNLVVMNGKEQRLEGVVVLVKAGQVEKVFVPHQAVKLVAAELVASAR